MNKKSFISFMNKNLICLKNKQRIFLETVFLDQHFNNIHSLICLIFGVNINIARNICTFHKSSVSNNFQILIIQQSAFTEVFI